MTTINKACLLISTICFYLRFISAYVIPHNGVAFIHNGDVTISATNLSKPLLIGTVPLPESVWIRTVCHTDDVIYMYYTNPHGVRMGVIIVDKESTIVYRMWEEPKRIAHHLMVIPNNTYLFVDFGMSLEGLYIPTNIYTPLMNYAENYQMIDMFYDIFNNELYFLLNGPKDDMILNSYHYDTDVFKKIWTVRPPYVFENALYDPSVRKIFFFIENIIVICPIDNPTFYQKFATATITSASLGPGYMYYRTKIEGVLYIFNTSSFDDAMAITNYDHELMMGQILVYSELEYSETFFLITKEEQDKAREKKLALRSNSVVIHPARLLFTAILHFKCATLHYG